MGAKALLIGFKLRILE